MHEMNRNQLIYNEEFTAAHECLLDVSNIGVRHNQTWLQFSVMWLSKRLKQILKYALTSKEIPYQFCCLWRMLQY